MWLCPLSGCLFVVSVFSVPVCVSNIIENREAKKKKVNWITAGKYHLYPIKCGPLFPCETRHRKMQANTCRFMGHASLNILHIIIYLIIHFPRLLCLPLLLVVFFFTALASELNYFISFIAIIHLSLIYFFLFSLISDWIVRRRKKKKEKRSSDTEQKPCKMNVEQIGTEKQSKTEHSEWQ